MAEQQLSLFGDDDLMNKRVVRASGGSGNPIIFRDYESYIAKFADAVEVLAAEGFAQGNQ